tara:strand:- start:39 stop:305 length:267 start_codon:yes stop_codon:yes gene_type:complete
LAQIPAPRPSHVSRLAKSRYHQAVTEFEQRQKNGASHHRDQMNPAVTLGDDVMAVSHGKAARAFGLIAGSSISMSNCCLWHDKDTTSG